MLSKTVYGALSVTGILLALLAGTSLGAQPTVIGTIVEVSPDTRAILLQVGVVDGEPVLRRFRLTESARIRLDGGFGRLADVVVGQTARVSYVRADGANLAEMLDISTGPPAGAAVSDVARAATGIEERRRYLDEVERTLDVLEESVEELSQFPDIENTTELTRRGNIVEDLESRIAAARRQLSSLSATASQEVWTAEVDRMSVALADISVAHERGWSVIGNR